jgi:hypothetical protein
MLLRAFFDMNLTEVNSTFFRAMLSLKTSRLRAPEQAGMMPLGTLPHFTPAGIDACLISSAILSTIIMSYQLYKLEVGTT